MDADGALVAAERLREIVSETPVPYNDALISVTISVGVATIMPGEPMDLASLIERADRALYAAKQGGRDRVEADKGAHPHAA
jgi:diguanylate cyclase (GGDEF)-like protein